MKLTNIIGPLASILLSLGEGDAYPQALLQNTSPIPAKTPKKVNSENELNSLADIEAVKSNRKTVYDKVKELQKSGAESMDKVLRNSFEAFEKEINYEKRIYDLQVKFPDKLKTVQYIKESINTLYAQKRSVNDKLINALDREINDRKRWLESNAKEIERLNLEAIRAKRLAEESRAAEKENRILENNTNEVIKFHQNDESNKDKEALNTLDEVKERQNDESAKDKQFLSTLDEGKESQNDESVKDKEFLNTLEASSKE